MSIKLCVPFHTTVYCKRLSEGKIAPQQWWACVPNNGLYVLDMSLMCPYHPVKKFFQALNP